MAFLRWLGSAFAAALLFSLFFGAVYMLIMALKSLAGAITP